MSLRPVDVVVDLDVPESGFFTDESMDGPYWTTLGVSRTFFGRRDRRWLIRHLHEGHALLDGEPVLVPRRVSTDAMHWRLVDVERFAHALAQGGYITVDHLVRVLEQVRLIAETWGYLEPRPIPTRVETYDPDRQEVHVVVPETPELTDDLDGSTPARTHVFVLDGIEYHVNLSDEHWTDLVAAMGQFIKIARRRKYKELADTAYGRAQMRAWAKEHGFEVKGYGPLPVHIQVAYLSRESST